MIVAASFEFACAMDVRDFGGSRGGGGGGGGGGGVGSKDVLQMGIRDQRWHEVEDSRGGDR
eukprot:745964-Hanusia_phi.AAC.2